MECILKNTRRDFQDYFNDMTDGEVEAERQTALLRHEREYQELHAEWCATMLDAK